MGKVSDKVTEFTELFDGQENTPVLLRQQKDTHSKLLQLYSEIRSVLHPLNVFYIKLIVHLADRESDLGWKLYLEETQAYRYYHGFSSFLGIRLVLQGGYQVQARKYEEAKVSLKEAEEILLVTHGRDHPVFKDMLSVSRVTIPRLQKLKILQKNMAK